MTAIPTDGAYRTPDHNYFFNGEGPFAGTTRQLDNLHKWELDNWFKQETAASAIRNLDLVREMIRREGTAAAQAWIAKIPDAVRDEAARIGSSVHTLADQKVRGIEVGISPEFVPFVTGYLNWQTEAKPAKARSEQMVFSTAGYAGTLDLICELDGVVTLIDIKTGKGVYRETRLQLAAYANAEWIGIPGDRKRYGMPKIERFAVLHLRPEQYAKGYRLIDFDVNDDDFAAFLACLRLTAWRASLNGKGT